MARTTVNSSVLRGSGVTPREQVSPDPNGNRAQRRLAKRLGIKPQPATASGLPESEAIDE
jgi:hypothetical protein